MVEKITLKCSPVNFLILKMRAAMYSRHGVALLATYSLQAWKLHVNGDSCQNSNQLIWIMLNGE